MGKGKKITVKDTSIRIVAVEDEDYISLTDMLRAKDGDFFISDWLRNRNTVEFLGIWESVNNPAFNYGEFATIRSQAGLNSYKISVKEWVAKTNAVGLIAKAGRYGGTFAHRDLAFEFGMWISPEFKIYLIKEFQRLKEAERDQLGWDIRRNLARIGEFSIGFSWEYYCGTGYAGLFRLLSARKISAIQAGAYRISFISCLRAASSSR